MKVQYNSALLIRARKLRNASTLSEVLLWNQLKGRKLMGYQFLRQKPIDNFIVDFYAPALKLAIEIDGSSHIGKEEYDGERQRKIESLGVQFLRFGDGYVKSNMDWVLEEIRKFIRAFEEVHGPARPRGSR